MILKGSCSNVLFFINDEIPVTCDDLYYYRYLNNYNLKCDVCRMKYKGIKND